MEVNIGICEERCLFFNFIFDVQTRLLNSPFGYLSATVTTDQTGIIVMFAGLSVFPPMNRCLSVCLFHSLVVRLTSVCHESVSLSVCLFVYQPVRLIVSLCQSAVS